MNDRRDLLKAAGVGAALLVTGTAQAGQQEAQPEKLPKTDKECVIAAGLTAAEAECWEQIAAAAGKFFALPELHPMDKQEVASAIHIIQNKLLGRPTYRKYVELAKKMRAN